MEDLRYPIGPFQYEPAASRRDEWIRSIADTPERLKEAVAGLTPEQLETPYRLRGWSIRQVTHHLPDSHMNAYTRFKLALTEAEPTIRPYHEDRWAELIDGRTAPVNVSLELMKALHLRWVMLLESLADQDFARTFFHPELGIISLEKNTALYAWHGRHHVAQITSLRERMGW